jgi:hypothetical protein
VVLRVLIWTHAMLLALCAERDAPIIPNATKNQGDCRSPVKNVSSEILREVNHEIRKSNKK